MRTPFPSSTMFSSSSSSPSFAPSFLYSPPLSHTSPPSLATFSPSHSTATAASCSYTCAEDPRLCESPRRVSTSASLYEILGVPADATSRDIKVAYRRLARICHPDVAGITRKSSSEEEFMKIHAAYCTLSDSEKRAVYDRRILCRSRPLTAGTSGFSGYWGTNWETDQCW